MDYRVTKDDEEIRLLYHPSAFYFVVPINHAFILGQRQIWALCRIRPVLNLYDKPVRQYHSVTSPPEAGRRRGYTFTVSQSIGKRRPVYVLATAANGSLIKGIVGSVPGL